MTNSPYYEVFASPPAHEQRGGLHVGGGGGGGEQVSDKSAAPQNASCSAPNAPQGVLTRDPPGHLLGGQIPHGAQVHGVEVPPNEFVSLCFSSANYDETAFENPEVIKLDRKPNPHVAFGFGPHLCLGAAHARLVVRMLMSTLCKRVVQVEVIDSKLKYENAIRYQRRLLFDSLALKFQPLLAD